MPRQSEETYCPLESETKPRCVVEDCRAAIAAEVHDADYGAALERFHAVRRGKLRSLGLGDERLEPKPRKLEKHYGICNRHASLHGPHTHGCRNCGRPAMLQSPRLQNHQR